MSKYGKKVNALISKIRAGDRQAEEGLFMYTYNHLWGVARRYSSSDTIADDAVQNAYVKIFRYLDSFDDTKDGYNWMCKIAENEAKSENARYVERSYVAESDNNAFCEVEVRDEIERFMNGLAENEKEILFLRFWLDKTYGEIAEIFGISADSAQMRVSRILKREKKYD